MRRVLAALALLALAASGLLALWHLSEVTRCEARAARQVTTLPDACQ
jgi:hypothetical protein